MIENIKNYYDREIKIIKKFGVEEIEASVGAIIVCNMG